MINKLIKLANYLDSNGLHKEADEIDELSGNPMETVRNITSPMEALRNITSIIEENFVSYAGSMDNEFGQILIDHTDGSPKETYFYDPDNPPEYLRDAGEELTEEEYESMMDDDRLIGDGEYIDISEVLLTIRENRLSNIPDNYVFISEISDRGSNSTKCVYRSPSEDDVIEVGGLPFNFSCPN